jgi:VanZ family protein
VRRTADARGVRRAAAHAPGADDALAAIVVAGIGYASLARYGAIDCTDFRSHWLRESVSALGGDLLGNVFAYLVLGLVLGLCWLRRRPSPPLPARTALVGGALVVAAGTLLSLSMETVQACLSSRTSSIVDLGANAGGTAIGWFVARLLHPPLNALLRGRLGQLGDGRTGVVVALATLAWIGAQTAPWVPAPSLWVARRNAAAAWQAIGAGFHDPWSVAAHGAAWLALGLAIALPARRPLFALPALCALAALVVGWRLTLPIGHGPPAAMLLTLPVAVLMAATVPLLGRRTCGAVVAAAAVVALLATQLEPAYGPIRPFRWRAMLLSGDPIEGIQQAFWFAWFALALVAGGHAADGRVLRWVALAVGLLAATEWLQASLPGRVGELSPTLVGLAGGGLAAALLATRGALERRR